MKPPHPYPTDFSDEEGALAAPYLSRYRVGVRRACEVVRQSRSAWYYQPRENDDAPLLRRIEEIAAARVRYGFRRIFVLLRREGWKANHKRVYRLYYQAGLNLRRKRPRRRKAAAHRLERTVLTAPNQVWSMDFVADALFDGRRLRALTVVDNFTKESLAIEVGQQLKGEDVVTVMERLRHRRDLPKRIQTDNGSEFISIALDRGPTKRNHAYYVAQGMSRAHMRPEELLSELPSELRHQSGGLGVWQLASLLHQDGVVIRINPFHSTQYALYHVLGHRREIGELQQVERRRTM